eukprot:TRINITY_DN36386_c0_g1_i1.p1 TRINITY_DN36386_c0_g1~~TRINITY_DN36386_c0_g1_i1.p1  ORF type:complete len:129 (-),score=27.26 TRINITY_DN36386_c0_g1_i1:15-347(-)
MADQSARDLLRKLGLPRNQLEDSFALLEQAGLSSALELRDAWAKPADRKWERLALARDIKEELMSYFESEMGFSYGKMQVPPKETCTPAGPNFAMITPGGQGMGPWCGYH